MIEFHDKQLLELNIEAENNTGEKTKISVLGCCVSRDAIAFNEERYCVDRCTQFMSLYSISDGVPMGVSSEMFEDFKFRKFAVRCLCQDANKNALAYLNEVNSDWILIDAASTRNAIFKWPKNYCVTDSYWVRTI